MIHLRNVSLRSQLFAVVGGTWSREEALILGGRGLGGMEMERNGKNKCKTLPG